MQNSFLAQRFNILARKQSGMTFIGLVLVIAIVVFLALIVMKVAPAYMEFSGVKKSLKYVASESGFSQMSDSEIRRAFDKTAGVSYVTVVTGKDLTIKSTDSGKEVTVDYQVVKPIVGNVSVLLDFSASSK